MPFFQKSACHFFKNCDVKIFTNRPRKVLQTGFVNKYAGWLTPICQRRFSNKKHTNPILASKNIWIFFHQDFMIFQQHITGCRNAIFSKHDQPFATKRVPICVKNTFLLCSKNAYHFPRESVTMIGNQIRTKTQRNKRTQTKTPNKTSPDLCKAAGCSRCHLYFYL